MQNIIDELDKMNKISDSQLSVLYPKKEMNILDCHPYSGMKYSVSVDNQYRIMSLAAKNFVLSGETLTFVQNRKVLWFRFNRENKNSSYWDIYGNNVIEHSSKQYFALKVHEINNLHMTLINYEDTNSDKKDFINGLKGLTTSKESCFAIFNIKDMTLKTTFVTVMGENFECNLCSKVSVRYFGNDKNALKVLDIIPKHLEIKLEFDLPTIIRLMKHQKLINKMIKQKAMFLFKDIEIPPRIITTIKEEEDLEEEISRINNER